MHALSSRCFNRLIFSFCLLAAAPSGVAAFERCDNANDLSATNHTFLQTETDDSDTLTTAKAIPNDSLPTDKGERKRLKAKIKKTGSWIKRFVRGFDDYDTEYIAPNYYNYTAMLQNTNFYQFYRFKGTDADGNSQSLQAAPQPGFKVGPYFGWRWIFLGYTFDIGHPQSATKSTEFNLSLYSSMLGCDLVYIRNTGDFTLQKTSGFSDEIAHSVRRKKFSGLDTYTFSLGAYYVFNHRHFSYPAAFSQSTVQRKSCGSWLLGFNYSHQSVDFDHTRLPAPLVTPDEETGKVPLIDELKIAKTDYRNCSINGGYAYNWVFAKNWLFAVSLTPSLGLKWSKGERVRSEDIWENNIKNFKLDFISRVGLVWNNSHYFAGASVITHAYDYTKNKYSLSNYIHYVNIYAGFMFNKKRHYRNQPSRK